MMSRDKIRELCQRAKRSSRELALIGTAAKDRALRAMARSLVSGCGKIVRENEKDVAAAEGKGLKSSLVDRLRLDRAGVAAMADSLAAIASLKDPVGQTIERRLRPNGLKIEKVRVPIGVILIIYESRPNVTSDCAGLCLKSSNAIILRGGSEAIRSNIAIFDILRAQAVRNGLPADCISMIRDTDRRVVEALLKHEGLIDLVIPRGGESLIREVARKSRIPVIKHYKGVCHTYVDAGADLRMAESICYNAKVQRPGVCNAMETMLVHRSVAADFLPGMIRSLRSAGVEIRGCAETRRIVRGVRRATEDDWYSEYLDLVLSVKVVKDIGEAIDHIMKYGSYHSDAIVTRDRKAADRFLAEVDSACVYVNASTRFTDGGQFGKGAEMGISTDKIHARGPMGLEELTSYKYIIMGNGQVRR
jgi:glutamate-5-semialdehyde dehydrogenase